MAKRGRMDAWGECSFAHADRWNESEKGVLVWQTVGWVWH